MATVNSTYTSPLSATLDKATGATIDETMTDAWSSNDLHCHGTAGYIGCQAKTTGAVSITNGFGTLIGFDSEVFDSDPNGAMHDNVTSNARITIRTAGVYLINAYTLWDVNATGQRKQYFRYNGSTIGQIDVRPAQASVNSGGTLTEVRLLAASDYVELLVEQSSGGSLNTVAGVVLSAVKL